MNAHHSDGARAALRDSLRIDCSRCCGLCCAALYFAKSEGFPADKPAGTPCGNLLPDFRCAVHADLAATGRKGCRAYDCFGAGQKVTQETYRGKSWRVAPALASQQFDVFLLMYQLHQMLWYLLEAARLAPGTDAEDLLEETEHMTRFSPENLLTLDLEAHRRRVNRLLRVCCKAGDPQGRPKHLIGKRFKRANLDGRDFSMALLLAADLTGCSLRETNLLGADLRDARLDDADLSQSLFLTQGQINAAGGNAGTRLPPALTRPISWSKQ